jgi:hypothetical protein
MTVHNRQDVLSLRTHKRYAKKSCTVNETTDAMIGPEKGVILGLVRTSMWPKPEENEWYRSTPLSIVCTVSSKNTVYAAEFVTETIVWLDEGMTCPVA